jgi:hypothetical protein
MHTLPESLIKSNPLFGALVNQLAAVVRNVSGPEDEFAVYEEITLAVANAATKEVLRRRLQALADGLAKDLLIHGKHYREHEVGTVGYHSLVGTLPISRATHREVGVRNGPSVVPLELLAGLIERATPALAYSVTLGYAEAELRCYAESMEAAHRELPSRSTLERMAKAIGTEARAATPRIEAYLRQGELVPDGANGVSLGMDRTAVPMEEDRPLGAPPKTRRKPRTKPYARAQPDPIDVNYRMAYVGTFSIVDSDGEELVTRRYTALPEEGPDDIAAKLIADLRNARRQQPNLKIELIQDGAPELWNTLRAALRTAGISDWAEGIDRWHLNERLGKALYAVEPDEAQRAAQLSAWNDALDQSDRAIDRITEQLGQHIEPLEMKGDHERLEVLLDHLVFIDTHHDQLRYHRLIRAGLPIGSGLTEGMCKSVVGQRTCGSGQRWRPCGIAAVLTLRAIHRSDRLPRFWSHFAKRYTAPVKRVA